MTRRVVLDVANYQGNLNFSALRQTNPEVMGVIIKATEGGWKWTNPYFDQQVQSARAAGLAIGFYTFVRPGIADQSDAQIFLERIQGLNPQLGVWLDCEVSDGVPAAQMLPRLLADAQYIAAHYPMKTGFYTADWWWGPNTVGSIQAHMENWPLWVAGYTQSLPQLPQPWKSALLWQFTDKYAGMNLDASVFLGNDAQWQWMLTGQLSGPAPKPPVKNPVKEIQAAVHAVQDGVFGPDTDKRCEGLRIMRSPAMHANRAAVKYAQQVMAFGPDAADGAWGPITGSHWTATVKQIQAALNVPQDGLWGPTTDNAYLRLTPYR